MFSLDAKRPEKQQITFLPKFCPRWATNDLADRIAGFQAAIGRGFDHRHQTRQHP